MDDGFISKKRDSIGLQESIFLGSDKNESEKCETK